MLQGQGGNVLVDTGLPNSNERIGDGLATHGLTYGDISLIVVTHAHGDHAGSAAWVREQCQAPIVAHEADLHYFEQSATDMTYCTTGLIGTLMLKSGRFPRPYAGFTPDLVIQGNDAFDLDDYGVTGQVFRTQGHSPGSLSITFDDNRVIAGDLVTSGLLLGGVAVKGRPKPPPFEENPIEVAKQLLRLVDGGAETFYLGHGGPLPASTVRRYAERRLQSR